MNLRRPLAAFVLACATVLLAGCSASDAYIPGASGGYTAPQLQTERGQLGMGHMVCTIHDPAQGERGVEGQAESLSGVTGVPMEESRRFVSEALAECGYLRGPQVTERLRELGYPAELLGS